MMAPAFMLTVAGFLLAALFYLWKPDLSGKARKTFAPLVSVLENKYGFDKLWIDGFAGGASSWAGRAGSTATSSTAWSISRRVVDVAAGVLRRTQGPKTFAPLVSVLKTTTVRSKAGSMAGSVKLGTVSRWIDSNIVDGVVRHVSSQPACCVVPNPVSITTPSR